MCNHLNLKILIHIFTIIYVIIIIIIMRDENFVAHLDGLGGTSVCRGTPVAHHCSRLLLIHALKMETTRSSETSVTMYKTIRYHNPEDHNRLKLIKIVVINKKHRPI
jgi:hypothetical protein